jgi:hypothetical protein
VAANRLFVLACCWQNFPLQEVAAREGPLWLTPCCVTQVYHSALSA